ncbi:hypothetical protein EIP86_003924 [Pleurotus ostreatoroseus]|nr:hypothetical protein EIP86_003924 [Pleurotus ostreatoroseus]
MPPKRKSDQSGSTSRSKKAHVDEDHSAAVNLVNAILADPDEFDIPEDDEELRTNLVALAKYARALEGRTSASAGASASVTKMSAEELESSADKIKRAAVAGIKKQMSWKPSCKTNSAKWSYDGICANPEVFGVLLGLGKAPTFKMKKMSKEEFQEHIGYISSSARYNDLHITGKDVNIRWSDTGEFKFSGTLLGAWYELVSDFRARNSALLTMATHTFTQVVRACRSVCSVLKKQPPETLGLSTQQIYHAIHESSQTKPTRIVHPMQTVHPVQLIPHPDHDIRSMRFLKQIVLPELLAKGKIEQIHVRRGGGGLDEQGKARDSLRIRGGPKGILPPTFALDKKEAWLWRLARDPEQNPEQLVAPSSNVYTTRTRSDVSSQLPEGN